MLCWSGWLRNAVNQKPVLLNHNKVLNKGLSFATTPILPIQTSYLQLLHNFDRYANSLRIQYTKPHNSPTQAQGNTEITSTTTVFRPMNFKHSLTIPTETRQPQCIRNYIHSTKCNLDQHLPSMYKVNKTNLTKNKKKESL